MNVQRAVSTRLPVSVLEFLCRLTAPIGGLKRRLFASRRWLVQRMGVALAPSDNRSFDASRSRGSRLRHTRLVRTPLPLTPHF